MESCDYHSLSAVLGDYRQMRNKTIDQNTKMTVRLVFIILVFIFFLNSNRLMGYKGDTLFTPMNEIKTVNNRDISIVKWTYSPKQKKMEVHVNIINNLFDGKDAYSFVAYGRTTSNIKVNIISAEDNYYVLFLENVPKDFREISLQIDILGTIYKSYTNMHQVEQVSEITEKTSEDYKIEQIMSDINAYQLKIQEVETLITEANAQIIDYEEQIENIESKKKYQTATEIVNSNSQIETIKQRISSLKKGNEEYVNNKTEYLDKIAKSREHLADLKGGS